MEKHNFKRLGIRSILLKILLLAAIIVTLFFYFKILLIRGIEFDGTFLKKEIISSSEIKYSGISAYGDINITIKALKDKSVANVIYELPNNLYEEYSVEFGNDTETYADSGVIIKKDDKVIFEGDYIRKGLFLMYKDGMPYYEEDALLQVRTGGTSPYNSNYKIPLKNVADLAGSANETIWGKIEFLIFALVLFGVTAFDKKYPLFFFSLKHFVDVTNPEPSDIYLFFQKVTWYIYPIIGAILMLYSIIWRFL